MIDVKKLKNSEKIRMYRNNFDVESEIRNKCKRELEQLKEQNKKPIGHTLKLILIIIAIISAVLFFVKPTSSSVSAQAYYLNRNVFVSLQNFEEILLSYSYV